MVRSAALRRSAFNLLKVVIWRVFRQIKQPGTRSRDGLLHSNTFVGRKVVDDDDIAALECWPEALFEIGEKGGSDHRPIDHERRKPLVMARAGHKSDGFPMPCGTRPSIARRAGSGLEAAPWRCWLRSRR